MTQLAVARLDKRFGAHQVLAGLNLDVPAGSLTAILGPSGSGKTTLLTLIGALRALQHGSCAVLGRELGRTTDAERIAIRRRIGFIFQDHQLLDFLTARQNVAMALEHDKSSGEADRIQRASAILSAVGLGHCQDLRPAQLSGGQRQRVAIARALVRDPDLLLADEPTAALDRQSGGEVMELVSSLARERGLAVLIVTHDSRIRGVADRILNMEDGQIGEQSAS